MERKEDSTPAPAASWQMPTLVHIDSTTLPGMPSEHFGSYLFLPSGDAGDTTNLAVVFALDVSASMRVVDKNHLQACLYRMLAFAQRRQWAVSLITYSNEVSFVDLHTAEALLVRTFDYDVSSRRVVVHSLVSDLDVMKPVLPPADQNLLAMAAKAAVSMIDGYGYTFMAPTVDLCVSLIKHHNAARGVPAANAQGAVTLVCDGSEFYGHGYTPPAEEFLSRISSAMDTAPHVSLSTLSLGKYAAVGTLVDVAALHGGAATYVSTVQDLGAALSDLMQQAMVAPAHGLLRGGKPLASTPAAALRFSPDALRHRGMRLRPALDALCPDAKTSDAALGCLSDGLVQAVDARRGASLWLSGTWHALHPTPATVQHIVPVATSRLAGDAAAAIRAVLDNDTPDVLPRLITQLVGVLDAVTVVRDAASAALATKAATLSQAVPPAVVLAPLLELHQLLSVASTKHDVSLSDSLWRSLFVAIARLATSVMRRFAWQSEGLRADLERLAMDSAAADAKEAYLASHTAFVDALDDDAADAYTDVLSFDPAAAPVGIPVSAAEVHGTRGVQALMYAYICRDQSVAAGMRVTPASSAGCVSVAGFSDLLRVGNVQATGAVTDGEVVTLADGRTSTGVYVNGRPVFNAKVAARARAIAKSGVVVGDGSVRATGVLPIALQAADADNAYFREVALRRLARIQLGVEDGWREHSRWLPLQVYGTLLSSLVSKAVGGRFLAADAALFCDALRTMVWMSNTPDLLRVGERVGPAAHHACKHNAHDWTLAAVLMAVRAGLSGRRELDAATVAAIEGEALRRSLQHVTLPVGGRVPPEAVVSRVGKQVRAARSLAAMASRLAGLIRPITTASPPPDDLRAAVVDALAPEPPLTPAEHASSDVLASIMRAAAWGDERSYREKRVPMARLPWRGAPDVARWASKFAAVSAEVDTTLALPPTDAVAVDAVMRWAADSSDACGAHFACLAWRYAAGSLGLRVHVLTLFQAAVAKSPTVVSSVAVSAGFGDVAFLEKAEAMEAAAAAAGGAGGAAPHLAPSPAEVEEKEAEAKAVAERVETGVDTVADRVESIALRGCALRAAFTSLPAYTDAKGSLLAEERARAEALAAQAEAALDGIMASASIRKITRVVDHWATLHPTAYMVRRKNSAAPAALMANCFDRFTRNVIERAVGSDCPFGATLLQNRPLGELLVKVLQATGNLRVRDGRLCMVAVNPEAVDLDRYKAELNTRYAASSRTY